MSIEQQYLASMDMDQMKEYIETYDYDKEAKLVFERAATAKYNRPRSKLNFPGGFPIDDKDYGAIMNPKKDISTLIYIILLIAAFTYSIC